MRRNIIAVEKDIIFMSQQTLQLEDEGDYVMSGRIIRRRIFVFGYKVFTKYSYQICLPAICKERNYKSNIKNTEAAMKKELKAKIRKYEIDKWEQTYSRRR